MVLLGYIRHNKLNSDYNWWKRHLITMTSSVAVWPSQPKSPTAPTLSSTNKSTLISLTPTKSNTSATPRKPSHARSPKMRKGLWQARKAHWMASPRKIRRLTSPTSMDSITNSTITIWFKLKKKHDMRHRKSNRRGERRKRLLDQVFLKRLPRVEKLWKWFKAEWRRHYSAICILSGKVASERCGRLSTRRRKTNMRWRRCLNPCK